MKFVGQHLWKQTAETYLWSDAELWMMQCRSWAEVITKPQDRRRRRLQCDRPLPNLHTHHDSLLVACCYNISI